jgi:uncharacterized protein (TIGR02646 family)
MKYINKTYPKSLSTKQDLEDWKANYFHQGKTLKEICDDNAIKTGKIWKRLPDYLEQKLRAALHEEQNSACCYCGCELRKRKNERIIEHFKVKSQDRWNRMFDYNNLLLSCPGNKFKWHKTTHTDTWNQLATRYDTSSQKLKELNDDLDSPIDDKKIKIGHIAGRHNHHCDNFRGDLPMPDAINPVNLPDCIDRFTYKIKKDNPTDEVVIGMVTGNDADAITTIEVLNLNAEILIEFRDAAVKEARNLFEEICEEAEDSEQSIDEIAQQKLNEIAHLYVVYRAYLKNHIPNLV